MGSHNSSGTQIDKIPKQTEIIRTEMAVEMSESQNENLSTTEKKMEISGYSESISRGSTKSKETFDKDSDPQDLRVPTLFQWNEGGECVFITGSFCGWSQKFPMFKTTKGNFELILNLPKGFYEFKFIVDGIWRWSDLLPIIRDSSENTNNYLDSNTYETPKEDNKSTLSKQQKRQIKNKILKDYFSNTYPSKSQLNTDSPIVPSQYDQTINIDYNTNQHNIGEMAYITRDFRIATENTASASITFPSHIILYKISILISYRNHLFAKLKKRRYIKSCSTVRIRAKFSTFIYIKPL